MRNKAPYSRLASIVNSAPVLPRVCMRRVRSYECSRAHYGRACAHVPRWVRALCVQACMPGERLSSGLRTCLRIPMRNHASV